MVVPTMDNLPRVPDAHGDVIDEKLFSDLYIRTTWVDAQVALDQIDKVSFQERYSAFPLLVGDKSYSKTKYISAKEHRYPG